MSIEELYKLYCDCGYQVSTDSRTIPAGAMFACKFTVSGGMPDDRVIENHNTILDKDDN